jgi:nicotinate-nucleotide adenylyltransferase
VLLMPVGIPPHKAAEEDAGAEHRLAMARLAVAGHEGLEVSELEVRRPGASFTVDTLRDIHASDPSVELTFIVGGDMASTLPRWREPREILRLARLAVAERDGLAREQVLAALGPLDAADRVSFLRMPPIEVSSSQVRDFVAAGRAIDELVPAAVADYISAHHLYATPVAR